MSQLVEQVTAVPPLHPYFAGSEKWVVGVSGGPDSVALLHLLRQIVGPERLVAAHLNHSLRPTAAADAYFVAQTAAVWQIPFTQQTEDVAALARQAGLSLEAAGRQARYAFLAEVARERDAPLIAVGHHADDQVETLLLHLLRGTGLDGLRGMELIRPLPQAPDRLLLRPLLHSSRDAIEAYCRENQLQPRRDETNSDTRFRRNRLRHELLPQLVEYNPQVKRHLRQMAAIVAADLALLDDLTAAAWPAVLVEQADGWLALDRSLWQAQPLALRRRLLRRALRQLAPQVEIGFRSLEQARLLAEAPSSGTTAVFSEQIQFEVGYERLRLRRQTAVISPRAPQLAGPEPLPLPVPGQVELAAGWWLETAVLDPFDPAAIHKNPDPWTVFLDAERVGTLRLRPRRPGERMQPLGLNGRSAKLKEIMVNRKIPAGLRRRWPLLVNDHHPLWLVGHLLDERARVTAATRRVWQITCHPPDSDSKFLLT
jgi:tRNA(Ile)-lysidine synthase